MQLNEETKSALVRGVHFSLVCMFCDAGQNVTNFSMAERLGWHDVEVATDLIQANFYGVCPNCVKVCGCLCCSARRGPARPETSSLPRDQGPDSAGAADAGG